MIGRDAAGSPAGFDEVAGTRDQSHTRPPVHVTGSGPARGVSLLGRDSECALLDGLVAAIRQGESRALVLRGEPGIGKTVLLQYLIESAPDLMVVRAAGVESEMELAYAGLHQLCAPIFDRLETLPSPVGSLRPAGPTAHTRCLARAG